MSTEIELKYLVLDVNVVEKIEQLFRDENMQYSYQETSLLNRYFDTADLNLRQHDMGLRVRKNKQHIEQTLKTAGQVVGGLHARPEYNVDISTLAPDLSLFPASVWQADQNIADIQKHLITLFSTDFTRCTWLLSDDNNNIIELAYDQGQISRAGQSTPINEIELELVKGDKSALFALASLLFQRLQMRPGIKSKAARGYALLQSRHANATPVVANYVCQQDSGSIASAFTLGLNRTLAQLQDSVEVYLQTKNLRQLADIKANLALMRHGFWLFEQHLTANELTLRDELSHFVHLLAWVDNALHLQELTNKTGNYRKKLDYSKQLIKQLKIEERRFPSPDDISQLLHSSRFNQLQLAILKLYLCRTESQQQADKVLSAELMNFAQQKIQSSLSEMSSEMNSVEQLTSQQYIAQSKPLYRSSLTGAWLAGLFDNELRDKFRRPWLDLQQGISELQSLWIIQQQLAKLNQAPARLVQWQQTKMEGLLIALNNSKAIAVTMAPYWLEEQ
ncbi:triphosphatase [Colwellia chukchiensis]|uniref:Triphosphatase n=1 Tax=Colwellia chukchiensis TaxID=641665 RepID=A0A1H7J418_9GAMM|nr:CYTH and CHAD domain-containing protein [Colwellia chukchiensis]SEK68637.1 triphosphatase [Colwellia chukchiensis]